MPEGESRDDQDPDDEDERRPRTRLESLIPDLIKKAILHGATALTDEKLRETLVSEIVRKAINVGSGVVENTEEHVRRVLSDIPIPKEVGDRVAHKLDEYKGELFRIVKQEVHEFLDEIDLGAEMQKMLTSLSFEIVTEIRFIPNEKGTGATVRPDVQSKVTLKKAAEGTRRSGSKKPTKET
ncbi:MAG: hypothetical protein EXR76_03085 [Myxococcales bacterium]|nr:hypothetical protein [Myxococcales bacterium]